METLAATLRAAKVIPVLTINDASHAVPLARALVAGGLTALEITLRTPAAAAAVAAIRREVPEAQAGLGTVTGVEDLALAADLDLPFAFSPGGTGLLLAEAVRRGVRFIPGVATASELMTALAHGFSLVKFFPAVQAGGIPMLRALAGPFPSVRFCPTGGITPDNAGTFLGEPNVVAVGGSWLAPPADQEAGAWAAITGRALQIKANLG
ncbi:MAG: bifunctional 4-hydroxy-2-oxoglutarate aldolase/2-dehydro-3-deoxy-phosphogluconate aldolase [Rhodospirillales bacterium]